MSWLRSKRLWLGIAHVSTIAAGVLGTILFPPAAPLILTGVGAITGLLTSPLNVTSTGATKTND